MESPKNQDHSGFTRNLTSHKCWESELIPAMVLLPVTQISKFHSCGYNAVRNARDFQNHGEGPVIFSTWKFLTAYFKALG